MEKISGDVIVGGLRAHPTLIVGGILHENLFFVPPDRFSGRCVNAAPKSDGCVQP